MERAAEDKDTVVIDYEGLLTMLLLKAAKVRVIRLYLAPIPLSPV